MFSPLAFGPDGMSYVTANEGKDKTAGPTLDIASEKVSDKPLVVAEDYDFRGRLIMGESALLGFRIVAGAESTMRFDPAMRALQAEVDKSLPGTVNLYGGADRRVPSYHGTQFYEAVKKTNPDVEWVLYPEEGHGWALPETRVDFWGRVEKFLGKHIGQP